MLHSFEVTDVVLESGWDSGGKKERKLRGEKEKEKKKKQSKELIWDKTAKNRVITKPNGVCDHH